MKIKIFILLTLYIALQAYGVEIRISSNLVIHKLSEHCYMHTQDNNNGLIYINNGEAIIVSTPDSDIETQNLIDWVKNEQKAKIVGYIIDRWHTDAMEGLDIVQQNGIKSYSYELTRLIAEKKGLPIPEYGFDPKLILTIGGNEVVCYYPGEAHTKDGIVVWIPSEKVLFGGNGIRNHNGWVGNIGDANLEKWSETVSRIKNEFGNPEYVIPGHGKPGGPELIDYTIDLYKTDNRDWILNRNENYILPDFKKNSDIIISVVTDSTSINQTILKDAIIYFQDHTKYIKIDSPLILYNPENKRIDSDSGYLEIYDKTSQGSNLRTGVFYTGLIIIKKNDPIGLRVILKEFAKD